MWREPFESSGEFLYNSSESSGSIKGGEFLHRVNITQLSGVCDPRNVYVCVLVRYALPVVMKISRKNLNRKIFPFL
jgi:hypothetical protein